jgi:hypothetical protein
MRGVVEVDVEIPCHEEVAFVSVAGGQSSHIVLHSKRYGSIARGPVSADHVQDLIVWEWQRNMDAISL